MSGWRRALRAGTVPALLISLGTMTANLLGYGFFLVLNRTQSPENLGALVALTNLAVIGAVPALALQLVVARRVARARATVRDQASAGGTALRTGTVVGFAMFLLTCGVTPVIVWALHLDSALAHGSYFDRTPYVEGFDDGSVTYAEHHRTLGDRVREITAAGLALVDLVEPEWPERNLQEWGGWSPTRGRVLPGTAIFVCVRPAR